MKRLKPFEIDQAIAKIREEYDHYIVHYFQPPARKKAFEQRWSEALRRGRDLESFLAVEIQVVKELLREAQQALEAGPAPEPKPVVSYADRVIEKLRQRIQGYPALGLPADPQLSPDVDKLYGTLAWFSRQVWPSLSIILKPRIPKEWSRLDQELTGLIPWQEKLPKELEAYVTFYRSQAPASQIAKAQNRCLLLGAAFWHGLQGVLTPLDSEKDELLQRSKALVERILSDFRLKDLKPYNSSLVKP